MNIRPLAVMIERKPMRWFGLALALVITMIGTACREELGPEPMPTAPISGRVTVSGVPISGGWLELLPVDGTVGRLRSARIEPDGTFQAERVAVGSIALRVVGAPLPPAEARMLGQSYLIRRTVPPDGALDLEIDLRAERLRIEAASRTAGSPGSIASRGGR